MQFIFLKKLKNIFFFQKNKKKKKIGGGHGAKEPPPWSLGVVKTTPNYFFF
jgi:hypothetical protein